MLEVGGGKADGPKSAIVGGGGLTATLLWMGCWVSDGELCGQEAEDACEQGCGAREGCCMCVW